MVTIRVDLSSDLRALRERHGWHQGTAAAFLGVDRTQVSRWEGGQRCSASDVHRLVSLGLRMSTVIVTSSLGTPGKPSQRLDVVTAIARVFEPAALVEAVPVAPSNTPQDTEQVVSGPSAARTAALLFAKMARDAGDKEGVERWEAQAARLAGEVKE